VLDPTLLRGRPRPAPALFPASPGRVAPSGTVRDAGSRPGHVPAAGAVMIGLAVEVSNHGARRLYQRLGYHDWGQGIVIDHWEETDAAGAVLKRNADPCHYLTKPIG
jgi:hypothetical protein